MSFKCSRILCVLIVKHKFSESINFPFSNTFLADGAAWSAVKIIFETYILQKIKLGRVFSVVFYFWLVILNFRTNFSWNQKSKRYFANEVLFRACDEI